jgi:glycosyltransferase involved in cell wall biosynthesis
MTSSGCLHLNPGKHGFGFSIEQGNPSDWARSMTKIVNNPDLAESLGQNGRKIASSELNVSDFNEKIVKFIDEVLRN